MQNILKRINADSLNSIQMRKFSKLMIIITSVILSSCANPLPPSGGPDDTTPPTIREFAPANASMNYKDKPIEIKFSEYVDKNSVVENIRISPELPLEFSWSGKSLEISPVEKMLDNTTYCISLEPNYKDLSGNRPTSAFSVIFSTGASIDSGKISGKVFSKSQGNSIFAYRIDNIQSDTLNIEHTKPDYRVKLGTSGDFQIQALKNGTYRLFLVNDRNDDALYTAGFEEFSAANDDVKVYETEGKILSDLAVFYNAKKIDKAAPELNSTTAIDSKILKLSFSESLDTNSINCKAFSIIDSATNFRSSCVAAYLSGSNIITAITELPMDKNKVYFAEINNSIQAIRDSSLNAMTGIIRSELFNGADSMPTVPIIIKSNIVDSAKKINLKQSLRLQFSQAMNDIPLDSIKLINATNKQSIAIQSKIINSSILEIQPVNELNSNLNYHAEIKLFGITSKIGTKLADTTIHINFTTDDIRLYGSLSGKIKTKSAQDSASSFVIILSDVSGRNQFTTATDSLLNWSFPALPEGDYLLNVYCDANNNNSYDTGSALPYSPSEKYYALDQKVKVAQRWKVEDMIIDLSK